MGSSRDEGIDLGQLKEEFLLVRWRFASWLLVDGKPAWCGLLEGLGKRRVAGQGEGLRLPSVGKPNEAAR